MLLRNLILVPVLAVLPLVACSQTITPPPTFGDDATCGADRLAALIDQPVTAIEQISSVAITLRVIRPGDAVTEDYSEQRLNVQLDNADRIIDLWCG